jgi:hypothetical protein
MLGSTSDKACESCKVVKPLTEFNVLRRSDDGKQSKCRACFSEYNAIRYASRRDEFLSAANARRAAELTTVKRGIRTSGRRKKNKAMGEAHLWTFHDELDAIQRCADRGGLCYCGCGLLVDFTQTKRAPDSAHLDRLDNDFGYRPDNVEYLRQECNLLKGANTIETLERFLKMLKGREECQKSNSKPTTPKSSSSATKSATTAVQVTLVQHTATVIPFASRAKRT